MRQGPLSLVNMTHRRQTRVVVHFHRVQAHTGIEEKPGPIARRIARMIDAAVTPLPSLGSLGFLLLTYPTHPCSQHAASLAGQQGVSSPNLRLQFPPSPYSPASEPPHVTRA